MISIIGRILEVGGCGLLLLAVAGDTWPLIRRPSERSLKLFARQVRRESTGSGATYFEKLCRAISSRFAHGLAIYGWRDNYLCRLLSPLSERFRVIHRSQDLFRYADNAFCSQAAQAFVDVAANCGLRARLVGLDGHVIAEAYYDETWHAYDPDYGVIPQGANGAVASVRELVENPELAAQAYAVNRLNRDPELVLSIFANGKRTDVAPGGHLSPRTALLQHGCFYAKYAVALALVYCGHLLSE
jgi:hypothetical protein